MRTFPRPARRLVEQVKGGRASTTGRQANLAARTEGPIAVPGSGTQFETEAEQGDSE